MKHGKYLLKMRSARLLGYAVVQPPIYGLVASTTQTSALMRLVRRAANSAFIGNLRPSRKTMLAGMLFKRHQLKILYSIVLFVAVLMVDAFMAGKLAPKMLLYYIPMFFYSRTVNKAEFDVSARPNPPTAIKPCGALAFPVPCTTCNTAVFDRPVLELIGCDEEFTSAFDANPACQLACPEPSQALDRASLASRNGSAIYVEFGPALGTYERCHSLIIPEKQTGSTAKTYTLDSATTPTSITETT